MTYKVLPERIRSTSSAAGPSEHCRAFGPGWMGLTGNVHPSKNHLTNREQLANAQVKR